MNIPNSGNYALKALAPEGLLTPVNVTPVIKLPFVNVTLELWCLGLNAVMSESS